MASDVKLVMLMVNVRELLTITALAELVTEKLRTCPSARLPAMTRSTAIKITW
jgi:hypothetical protein